MKHLIKPTLDFLRWDLRTVLAAVLVLAIFIGWSLAQTPLYTFDFGTAASNEVAGGAIHVRGSLTLYPTSSPALTYGWQTAGVQEFSNPNIPDLLNRDYNGSSSPFSFRINGLDAGLYDVKFVVGDPTSTLATRIGLTSQSVDVVADHSIRSVILTHEVMGSEMVVSFASADGASNWGINAITITSTTGTAPQPSFQMSLNPSSQTVAAGGVATYTVGLTPVENYSANVDLSIAGLVAGISAEFVPARITASGSSELRLRTVATTSPNTYEFLISAKGTDAASVVQNGIVRLTVQSSGVVPPVTGGDVVVPSNGGVVVEPPVITRSESETEADFQKIDEFVAEYQEKVIAERKDIKFIEGISAELYGVPILPELPKAKTPLESFLQNLVQAGLIQSTIDTAPPAPTEPNYNQDSFWQRFKKTLFAPAF